MKQGSGCTNERRSAALGILDAVDNLGELAGILTRFVLPFVIVVLGLSIAGGNQARASKAGADFDTRRLAARRRSGRQPRARR